MATKVRDLRFTVSADTEKLQKALNTASQSSRRFADGTERDLKKSSRATTVAQGHMREVTKTGLSAARSFVRMGVAAAGFASATAYVHSATGAFEDLAKSTKAVSRITGMSSQDSSRWIEAAKLRGVASKQLSQGFITLSRNMTAATDSGSKQEKMFRDLGISSATIKKGDTQSTILKISDAFEKLPDGARKSAFAQQLFGRQAQTMLPILNKGSDALREQLGLSDKYGTTLDDNQVEKGLKAAAVSRELTMAMDGLKIQIGGALLPIIDKGKEIMTEFFVAIRSGEGPIGSFAKDAAGIAKTIGSIVEPAIAGAARAFGALPEPLQKASFALGAIGIVMAATTGPIGLGIAAVVAGAVLIKRNWDTIGPAFENVSARVSVALESVKQWVGDAIGNVKRWLDLGGSNAHQFGQAASNAFNILKGAVQTGVTIFKWGFENVMLPIIKRVLPAIQQYISGVFQSIGGIIKIFTGVFTGDWRKAWEGVKQLTKGMLNQVLGIFRATTAPLRAVAAAMFRGVVNAIKGLGGAIYSAGKWYISRLIDGVQAYYGTIFNIGKTVGGKVVSGIKAVSGAIAGAGRWVVSRVGDGISAAIGALANIGKKIANTIINAVKSALGIHSPSTVFREIGQHMVSGLANGITPGNVASVLGKSFGGTGKFVKALVKKGFASVKNLPGKFLKWFGGDDSKSGLGTFDGKQVANWIIPELKYARAHGWGGSVTSGYRTQAEQDAIRARDPRAAVVSNHSGINYPGGAIDVGGFGAFSQGQDLKNALAGYTGKHHLVWGPDGGNQDGGHFSATGHARGGKYTSPAFFFAEEAPRFPEYYISTNPRDRSRMVPLAFEAMHDLGVPGFKGGGKKAQKAKTHKAVETYTKKQQLADAIGQAGLKVGKDLGKSVGTTLDGQIKKVDALLKRKGLSYDDRITLLNLRAQLLQAKAAAATEAADATGDGSGDGSGGSGSGGSDGPAAVDPQIFIDLKASLDKLTESINTTSKTSAIELLQLVGDMRDGQIGGSAADAFRIANQKAILT